MWLSGKNTCTADMKAGFRSLEPQTGHGDPVSEIQALERWETENQKFKVILGYRAILRSVWITLGL